MSHHRSSRARPLRALAAALAIVGASLAVAAPQASAGPFGPNCNYDFSFNACLRFDTPLPFWHTAQVGIDVPLPEQWGREIVACGAQFKSSLWGDDSPNDSFIRNLNLKAGWPVATSNGISAEFDGPGLQTRDLDEDSGEDELVARVSYYDCHTGLTRHFLTGIVRGDFRGR